MADSKEKLGRRDLLKAIGLGAGAAAVPAAAAAQTAAPVENADQRRKARYQESAHVKRFYETNRYPK